MRQQVAIIGMGRFGISLASTLFGMGYDVLALDIDEKRVQSVSSQVTHAAQADATSETVLKALDIGGFDVVIVAMGSAIQSSVLSTILLKKLGVAYVIARADNELHRSILEKIGADRVVSPEREMGKRVAHGLTLPNVLDYIPVAPSYGVAEVAASPYFVGKTLSELELGQGGKWGIAVLLIQRGKEVIVTPDLVEDVRKGDVLVLAGSDKQLNPLLSEAAKETASQQEHISK
ncbi:MAG: TrkA family potassium uptake protein [Dehalococcoidia bacterium]|nr:TrkA family potassium uptake protein [Dehalococcoidia bacterium]